MRNSKTFRERWLMRTTIFHFSAAAVAFVATAAIAHGQDQGMTPGSLTNGATAGEQSAAPYIDRTGGPRGAGAVMGTAEVSGIIEAADRERYDLGESVYITLPTGVTASPGDEFYTYQLDSVSDAWGQIVIPTGVLQVVRPGVGPEATTARIVQEFGNVRLRQGVLALPTPVAPPATPPSPVDAGITTRVVWVSDNAVLPGVQYYVALAAAERDGVHVGDRFTIYRPAVRLDESTTVLPAADIAVVQVVRVTAHGSTAIVVDQTQPAIHPGVAARLSAKAP
jgi:hypothetical protein